MSSRSGSSEAEKLRLERDFYLRLLELGSRTDLEPFLEEALALVVEVTGARQGYLELHEAPDDAGGVCFMAHGFSAREVEAVRSQISSGIIAEALRRSADLFPEGGDTGELETWAMPEIWSNRADFEEKLKAAEAEAIALQSVAVETAFPPALGKLGDTCKACHQTYRRPKG